ncbi:MAG: hypothetical protein WC750_02885 [Patescibacteria group bacterium]|jgi:hypothetical protein
MIINMEKGNPIGMNLAIKELLFMLPVAGACQGFAAFLAHCCWSKLNQVPAYDRHLGSVMKKTWQLKTFCGIVCYYERDGKFCYDKAPGLLSIKLLRPVTNPPDRIGFVMSGSEIPGEERFLIMRALARTNLQVEVFDFNFSC